MFLLLYYVHRFRAGALCLLWSATHLTVSIAPGIRADLIRKIGLMPYKAVFSLLLVIAVVLMVLGWKAAPAISLWLPPAGLRHITMLLVPIAVLIASAVGCSMISLIMKCS